MIAVLVQLALGAPSVEERLQAQDLARAVVREALGGPLAAVPDGYALARDEGALRLAGPDGEVLLVRRGRVAPLLLQTPHPRSDLYTGELGARLFDAGFGQALLTTTARRADLDVAHDAGSLYQSLHVGSLDALHAPVVAQIHGFADGRAPVDAVVGAGLASVPAAWVDLFGRATGGTVATGAEVPALAGRTNVQGWATLGHGTFVHLELSRALRDQLLVEPGRLHTLGRALTALAEPAPAPVGVSWSLPRAAGVTDLPVGEPVLVPGASDGALPGPSGWVLPGGERRRTSLLPEGHRRLEGRAALPAWEAWVLRAARAAGRGRAVPAPPWGEGLAERVAARVAGVGHRAASRHGLWIDASLARGAVGGWQIGRTERVVVGGGAPWVARAAPGEHVRLWLARDDAEPGPVRVAIEARWRGRVVARREAYVGPRATLSLDLPFAEGVDALEVVSDAPMVGVARRVRHRPPVGWRALARSGPPAERAMREGRADDALAAYAREVDAPGPRGDWARARVAWLADDAAVLDAVLGRPAETPAGAAALADAIVRRRELADRADAATRVGEAPAVDPVALAAWRDEGAARRAGARPAGAPATARPRSTGASARDGGGVAPVGGAPGAGALRAGDPLGALTHASGAPAVARGLGEHTRLRVVQPEGAPLGPPRLAQHGPGVGVTVVRAGQTAALRAPMAERPDRLPAVTVRAPGPARFTLGGDAYALSAAAEVPIAIAVASPGDTVPLRVDEGEVALAPANVAAGGEPGWLIRPPAASAFTIAAPPGPGAVEFVVLGPDSLVAQSTGRVGSHGPTTPGWVDAGAFSVTVYGGGEAAIALRTLRLARDDDGDDEPMAFDARVARIAVSTAQVDGGETAARLDRARDLAALSFRELALRDLEVAAADPALVGAVAALRDRSPGRRTGASVGPADRRAAELLLDAGPLDLDGWAGVAARSAPAWARAAAIRALVELGSPERAVDAALRAGEPDRIAEIADRVSWRPIPALDASAGLQSVEVAPQPASSAPVARVRAALLALPWPVDDGIVLRDGAARIGREGAVVLSIYCRDEALLGRGCRVDVASGDARLTTEIADGATQDLPLDGPGADPITVAVAGEDRAVGVRAVASGRAIPVGTTRAATRVDGLASVAVAPGLVRVEVLDGAIAARVGGHRAQADSGRALVLPALDPAGTQVVLEGSGLVVVSHGRAWPQREIPDAAAAPPPLPDRPAPAPWAPPARPEVAPLQGSRGTVAVGLDLGRQQLFGPREPWDRGELSADWFLRRRAFVRIGGWARGPTLAGGAVASVGTTWARGWGVVEGRVGSSDGAAGGASSARARVAVRQDLGHRPILRLRGSAWTGSWSESPLARVDPSAWTPWSARGPHGAIGSASVLLRSRSNLAAEAGVDLDSRRFGYRAVPVSAFALGAWALSPRTVWSGQVAALPGEAVRVIGRTRIEHGAWSRDRTRFSSVWAQVSPARAVEFVEARVGVRVLLSPARDFADLPPDALWFPTLRTAG